MAAINKANVENKIKWFRKTKTKLKQNKIRSETNATEMERMEVREEESWRISGVKLKSQWNGRKHKVIEENICENKWIWKLQNE